MKYEKFDAVSAIDFVDGQQDCRDGREADESRSPDYTRGYGAEYELEQIRSHRSLSNECNRY